MAKIRLKSAAWYGDSALELDMPEEWVIEERAPQPLPALSADGIRAALAAPIGARPLEAIARGRRSGVIIIDDITRPTPTALLLPPVIAALRAAGIERNKILVMVAGGTHDAATAADVAKKVGSDLDGIDVVAHDMRASRLEDLGTSPCGIPITVNAQVAAADVTIGIGGIYPHPAAGFSGGSKIVAPGVCGFETASQLHDTLPKAGRGNTAANAFRNEVDAIAGRIGLDFIVNAVLNQDRQVGALFCGDTVAAHGAGMRFARDVYAVDPADHADIVIADAYPFDTYLHFALDRAFWPFAGTPPQALRIGIAACPAGIGAHELDVSLRQRLRQRLMQVGVAELARLPQRWRNLRDLLRKQRLEMLLFSPGINRSEPAAAKVRGELFETWPMLTSEVRRRRPEACRVVLYRCAPLLIPVR
jgi:lactate racemase